MLLLLCYLCFTVEETKTQSSPDPPREAGPALEKKARQNPRPGGTSQAPGLSRTVAPAAGSRDHSESRAEATRGFRTGQWGQEGPSKHCPMDSRHH